VTLETFCVRRQKIPLNNRNMDR